MNAKRFVYQLCDSLFNLIDPEVCTMCGCGLNETEKVVCLGCRMELPSTRFERYANNAVEMKFWGRADIHSAFSAFYYRKNEKLQKMVHAFKYHGNREAARFLGREIGLRMKDRNFAEDYDYLVPVPLHPNKLRIRGYNQSMLIAEGIREVTGMEISNSLIERVSNQTSQTKKNKFERWDSASQSYCLANGAERHAGIRVLLVDDVLTTGATIEACCNALKGIPDVRIGFVTVGIASD